MPLPIGRANLHQVCPNRPSATAREANVTNMPRALVWSLRLLGALVLLLAVAGGAGYLWLRGSLPQTEGTVEIAGL